MDCCVPGVTEQRIKPERVLKATRELLGAELHAAGSVDQCAPETCQDFLQHVIIKSQRGRE